LPQLYQAPALVPQKSAAEGLTAGAIPVHNWKPEGSITSKIEIF
jgi:hypothetical protein